MLHMVSKSPFGENALTSCLAHLTEDAAVLLIEDAVVAALAEGRFAGQFTGVRLYVLGPDLAARGLADKDLVDGATVIDYAGFVALCTAYPTVQSWF